MNVQYKNSARTRAALEHDLQALRKGSGLKAEKIGPSLLHALAQLSQEAEETFSRQQAHTVLLTQIAKMPDGSASQALRAAYGLDVTGASLTLRRRLTATALGKHTDTIERYENQAIRELAGNLGLGRFQPEAMPAKHDHTEQHTIGSDLQQLAMRQAAAGSLSALLALPSHSEALVTALQSSAPAYMDTDIRIRQTRSSKHAKAYSYDLTYAFSGAHQHFNIAIVFNIADGEQLMAAGAVNEYCLLNNRSAPRMEARALINRTSLLAVRTDSGRQHELPFTVLDDLSAEDTFSGLSRPLQGPCWILQAVIPQEWRGQTIRYRYHTRFDVYDGSDAYPYTYSFWYAPGLMYVRSLEWDFDDWAHQLPTDTKFRVISFLGGPAGSTYSTDTNRIVIKPNSWLMRGNGLNLMWFVP